jgi:hypothetical protein
MEEWLMAFNDRKKKQNRHVLFTASVENENDQQYLQNCMNEAAFSNCNAEDYINIDKDVQTQPATMDINALAQNFKES